MRDPVTIVFTVDGRYAMCLSVAICSAAFHCDRNRELTFIVFYSKFPKQLRLKIEGSLTKIGHRRARIEWKELNLTKFADLKVVHSYMSGIIYARLAIPDLLPANVKKALYLDSDLVVVGDVAELWDTNMGDKALWAVRDRIGTVGSKGGLTNYRQLGIPADAKYFNSGVLLMNLEKWRKKGISQLVLEHIRVNSNVIQMGDQDGLNAVLFDDWGELDFRWNWQVVPDMQKARDQGCWGLDLNEKSIIHYVTSVKPWLPACHYDERSFFFRYLDKTAWAGWRVPFWKECFLRLKGALRSAFVLSDIR